MGSCSRGVFLANGSSGALSTCLPKVTIATVTTAPPGSKLTVGFLPSSVGSVAISVTVSAKSVFASLAPSGSKFFGMSSESGLNASVFFHSRDALTQFLTRHYSSLIMCIGSTLHS